MKAEDLTVPLPKGQSETLERIYQDRQRYKRERDDLLQALFQPYETRKHLAEAILAGDPMPYRSEAQSRLIHAKANEGIPWAEKFVADSHGEKIPHIQHVRKIKRRRKRVKRG